MRGAQKCGLCDTSEQAAAAPVIHQGIPENILTLRWTTSRSVSVVRGKPAVLTWNRGSGKSGKADGKLVNAVERGV